MPSPFKSHYGFLWHITPRIDIFNSVKKNLMSIVVSNKRYTNGQIYRHHLVRAILGTNLPIDIYGNGCSLYEHFHDSRIKGYFGELEPYSDYKYTICVENFALMDYFSEKITNPLLCGTIPIYLGCKKIDTYFSIV